MTTNTATRPGVRWKPHTRHGRRAPVAEDEITRWARPSPEHAAAVFRTALLQALDEISSTSSGSLALTYSRAALRTWDLLTGLQGDEAERVRIGVYREECEAIGVGSFRAGITPEWVEPEEKPDDDLRIPVGRRLPGERVRRSRWRHCPPRHRT